MRSSRDTPVTVTIRGIEPNFSGANGEMWITADPTSQSCPLITTLSAPCSNRSNAA